jgi:hypothetical protein
MEIFEQPREKRVSAGKLQHKMHAYSSMQRSKFSQPNQDLGSAIASRNQCVVPKRASA